MPTGAHDPHMGTNQRRLDMLEKRARDAVTDKAAREAKRVGIWNARHAANRDLWFYPTIGAPIAAECPWLRFYCPACRQIGEVDLRKLDRHRGANASRPALLRGRTHKLTHKRLWVSAGYRGGARGWRHSEVPAAQALSHLSHEIEESVWRNNTKHPVAMLAGS
jgi:hypothetical protein